MNIPVCSACGGNERIREILPFDLHSRAQRVRRAPQVNVPSGLSYLHSHVTRKGNIPADCNRTPTGGFAEHTSILHHHL